MFAGFTNQACHSDRAFPPSLIAQSPINRRSRVTYHSRLHTPFVTRGVAPGAHNGEGSAQIKKLFPSALVVATPSVTHAKVSILQKCFATCVDEWFYFLIYILVHISSNSLIQYKINAITE